MTLSERDRRILLVLAPIVILIAYWFLIFSPKRDDLSKARDAQHTAEQARDAAVAQAAQLEQSKQTFAADYAEVVRLGKAIPATVDAPSLLIQLTRAASGTHIDVASVTFGARAPAVVPTPPPPSNNLNGAQQPAGNAAAGGAPAATAPGGAVENAGNAVAAGNGASAAAGGTTGTTGATGATSTTTTTTGAPASTTALDSVALTFNFTGTYFDLADFFHRLKRFVYVAGNHVIVRGRLLSIDNLAFAPGASATTGASQAGQLTATVGATVYLSSATTGVTGGATPQGPAGTTTTTTTPSGSQTSSLPLATASAR